MTSDLFEAPITQAPLTMASENSGYQPLAARLRPRNLAECAGQEHLLGSGKPLRQAIDSRQLHSMIFWGPPGVG